MTYGKMGMTEREVGMKDGGAGMKERKNKGARFIVPLH